MSRVPPRQDGVWIVAMALEDEGIIQAIPYATEKDARRAIRDGVPYSDSLPYFVPWGHDLGMVMDDLS